MSGVRSLNRVEAAERSALLGVKSYHVEVDLTVLPVGPEVRCTSTVRFVCRQEGAQTFVDCCARVVSATLQYQPPQLWGGSSGCVVTASGAGLVAASPT